MSEDTLFSIALGHVLKMEGGYNDIKEDKGGATNYGISLRFLQSLPEDLGDIDGDGDIDKDDIKNISLDNVYEIYKTMFWDKYVARIDLSTNFHTSTRDNLKLVLFDMYVNHSPRAVNRMLQRAVNACRKKSSHLLVEDGLWGRQSSAALNQVESLECLMTAIRSERHAYYRELVLRDDSQKKFLKGWRKRALEIIK